jgi:regulator of protease activity HflC (stomatin/prohibitin superfamily)
MTNKSATIIAGLLLVLVCVAAWMSVEWFFFRFYVGPNQMAVIISKSGDPLPAGEILADDGQKGIQKAVLGEGRHFLNPVFFEHEIHPVTFIPPGKIGLVTSKVGANLPEGDFLANANQKGIWRQVLGPGKYRLNPYGYNITVVDAISVPVGYCGVITSLSGKQAAPGEFAKADEKGVRKDILQPGLYYINPKAYKIDVLEIGVNQVSLLGKEGGRVITKGQLESTNSVMEELQGKVLSETNKKRMDYMNENALPTNMPPAKSQSRGFFKSRSDSASDKLEMEAPDEKAKFAQQRMQMVDENGSTSMMLAQFIEFPSRDGFQISLDMTVEVELLPKEISWIFSRYGDLPAVVDKIIMPQITSISRNKGSEYQAKDFIMGEGREKFQNELTKALATTLATKKIIVHNALIRHVEVPQQILEPIQQASIAIQQNLTNLERQNTAKKLAELNTEIALIEQRREQVAQETSKLRAEIKADEEKQVAQIKAEAIKKAAEIARETARNDAETVRILGQAQASAIQLVEGEKVNGIQMKTAAYDDYQAYTLTEFARSLNPDVKVNIIHSGTGTLWTDLKNANLGELGGAALLKGNAE